MKSEKNKLKNYNVKILRTSALLLLSGAFIFLLLAFWPEPSFPSPSSAGTALFEWDRGKLFEKLEKEFTLARAESPGSVMEKFELKEGELSTLLQELEKQGAEPRAETLKAIEATQFSLAALAAVRAELLPRFRELSLDLRGRMQRAAVSWRLQDGEDRKALFRIVTGGRMAFEEALMQHPAAENFKRTEAAGDVPSACPSTAVDSVAICSGDIFLSRGDAPTSALIARANFFPGEFSHAALVYVGKNGALPLVLESLIEEGSKITPLAEFMKSHRHRLVLLRLRPGSPDCVKDPLLPHRAASRLHARFSTEKVPYDFEMLPDDGSALFCSEAVAAAYAGEGAKIFPGRSRLDTPGIIRMMGPLGAKKFDSYMPQDLELNPDLSEAAEWFYPETLRKDRIEEAVLSALFWEAEKGASLRTTRAVLAGSRLISGISDIQSFLGLSPLMPEGMSASSAARLHCYIKYVYPLLNECVSKKAGEFKKERGYEAPRWTLAGFAEQAVKDNREQLKQYFH